LILHAIYGPVCKNLLFFSEFLNIFSFRGSFQAKKSKKPANVYLDLELENNKTSKTTQNIEILVLENSFIAGTYIQTKKILSPRKQPILILSLKRYQICRIFLIHLCNLSNKIKLAFFGTNQLLSMRICYKPLLFKLIP
jgi:hypothetical protein